MSESTVLNFKFVVLEPDAGRSERVAEYRELILRGLQSLRCDDNVSHEEHVMIERLMYDHPDFSHVRREIELRWQCLATINDPESNELDRELATAQMTVLEARLKGVL